MGFILYIELIIILIIYLIRTLKGLFFRGRVNDKDDNVGREGKDKEFGINPYRRPHKRNPRLRVKVYRGPKTGLL